LDGTVFAEGHNEVSVAGGEETSASIPMILEFILISTREELAAIGTNTATLGRKYILANPIPDASNWTPIGNEDSPFTGIFDGNNQIINSLSIPTNPPPSATLHFGLFSLIGEGAVVRNVRLENVAINLPAHQTVGGLAGGVVEGGLVENCSAIGSVIGMHVVGGLVGWNLGIIQNSYAAVNITGVSEIGGLVGANDGIVRNSYATGNVTGATNIGGLVGGNDGTVENNSHASGEVIGEFSVGGLVGGNDGTVRNSYAAGKVEGEYSVGGLVGENLETGTIENSYATGDVEGEENVGGLVGFNEGIVRDSYATGDVTGISNGIGGLAGDNNGTVENSYAIGDVSGNSMVGGVVGLNNGTVQNSVALNLKIVAIDNNYGRVTGSFTGTLSNNYGRSDMQHNNNPSPAWNPDLNGRYGANIASPEWYNRSWWENPTYGWNTVSPASAWNFGNSSPWNPPNSDVTPNSPGTLPTLRNMPPGTQSPHVRN
jgi:hypothetical protein